MPNPIISADITYTHYRGGEVDITCVITNNSKESYRLLSWHTPLHGNGEFWDMLKVTLKGKGTQKDEVIPSDILHVKRGQPTRDDYVLLKAGESTAKLTFSLTEVYEIVKKGSYEITLDTKILDIAKTSTAVPRKQEEYNSIDLKSNTLHEELHVGSPPTIAENYRTQRGLAGKLVSGPGTSGTHAKLKPVRFTPRSTDAQRQKQVVAAHEAAYVWVKAAAQRLSNDDHFERWFGTFDKDKQYKRKILQKILESDYKLIAKQMETKSVVYDFNDSLKAYARVFGKGSKWDGIVELGKSFWKKKSKLLGFDSHAGTIIHELSHVVDRTSDINSHWYGISKSKKLADISPEFSIMHADSLEYFAETTFPFEKRWLQGSQIMNIENGKPADYTAIIDEISPTAKNLNSANKMRFSAKEGKFQMVVTEGTKEIVGTLSEDFRIINWDTPFGSSSQQVIAGANHYGAIGVSGAGTEDANGIYQPINRADLPLDAPEYTSKLMWRHTKIKNLVIVHTDECWWISDYKDCTRDLYVINDADPLTPPVKSTWTPCTIDDDNSWDVGVAPAPTVKFGLMWAAEPALGYNPDTFGLDPGLGGFLLEISKDGSGLVIETQDQGVANYDDAKALISDPSKHSENGKKFSDWRLPTAPELAEIQKFRKLIGGFTDQYYLSESGARDGVWGIDFKDGKERSNGDEADNYVRTVRDIKLEI